MGKMFAVLRAMDAYEQRSDDDEATAPRPEAVAWAEAHQDDPEGDELDATCPDCHGNGLVTQWNKAVQAHTIKPCPSCNGTGKIG